MRGEASAWAAKAVNMQLGVEQRRIVFEQAGAHLHRRSIPAVYVVDSALRVLYSRVDPSERRRECRPDGVDLPPIVAHTVRSLMNSRSGMQPVPDALSSAPNASLVVRVIWLDGEGDAMAVLVERLKMRNYLNAAEARYSLSPREVEVLGLLLEGSTNAEIGQCLHIAESTAIFHVKRLLQKMQARNRTELVSKLVG
ncbi:MAG: response regulator transcription factor [Candidatus Baltobacteraceae bacterium]